MTTHSPAYKKLGGKHRKFLGTDRLWLGTDHLLMVSSTGISEDYKRFFFKDIQAINVMKTRARMLRLIIGFIILGAAAALTALAYTQSSHDSLALIPGAVVGTVVLLWLIWLLIKGPSCKCFIYTSVQKENLTPVNTVKRANTFYKAILPKIEAIQGKLPTQALDENEQRFEAAPSAIMKHAVPDVKKEISPFWHRVLFLSLWGASIFTTLQLLYPSPVLLTISGIFALLILLFNTITLVKQVGSTLALRVKVITIASIVSIITSFACDYAIFVFFMFKNIEKWATVSNNQWELAKLFAQINPFDYPLILGVYIFYAATFFILGLLGLIFLWTSQTTGQEK